MAPVVADASALLALGKLDRLDLLRDLFQQVSIPSTVSHEIARTLPRLPDWIRVIEPRSVSAIRDAVGLHQGEIEAIALALEVHASLLILDDLPARRHALGAGLAIIGTAGVLVMAKRSSLIPSVREPLDALRRSGFRLRQDVYEQILIDAGEQARGR
jgi:predicted nucleic acid-binding protein